MANFNKLKPLEAALVRQDFTDCQGAAVDIGGYYRVDVEKTSKAPVFPKRKGNGFSPEVRDVTFKT